MLGNLFGNASFGRMRQAFGDQFTPDGSGFLYRRNLCGDGYRVTAAERDAFVADYKRHSRWLILILVAVTLVLISALAAVSVWLDIDITTGPPEIALIGCLCLLVLLSAWANVRAYAAPARALERRAPSALALSPEERRRVTFERLTWGRLAGGAAVFAIIPFKDAPHQNPFVGWSRLWLIFGVAGLIFAAVQAFRKWRFEGGF